MFESIGSHLIAKALWSLFIGGALVYLFKYLHKVAKRTPLYQDWLCSRALRRLFDFPNDQKVLIVLPEWKTVVAGTKTESLVAFEDMLAASLVDRSLILARRRENSIKIIFTEQFALDPANRRENLVLLCSPHRNPVTNEVLQQLQKRNRLAYPFNQSSGNQGIQLRLDSKLFLSPSYKQTSDFKQQNPNVNPYEHEKLEDYALIARFVNPWDTNKKIVLLAGIRAFGTWGAAHALREKCVELDKLIKDKDFAVIVKCTLSTFRITECSFAHHVTILQ